MLRRDHRSQWCVFSSVPVKGVKATRESSLAEKYRRCLHVLRGTGCVCFSYPEARAQMSILPPIPSSSWLSSSLVHPVRPSAQDLLKHPFMKAAKPTDALKKLLEARRAAKVRAIGEDPRGTYPWR